MAQDQILNTNEIIHSDCLTYMKTLPNDSIDLILADPPYNKKVANWDTLPLTDYIQFMTDFVLESKRILKPNGSLVAYNQQPMASFMFTVFYSHLQFVDEIIWYYKNGGGGKAKLRCKNTHQLVYWFSKTAIYTCNIDTIRQPYSGTRAKYKHNIDKNPSKTWTPNENGAVPTNVWETSIVRQNESTQLAKLGIQKPLALTSRLIELTSNPNDLVFIPFAGSGTEIEACMQLTRNYIATERNLNYIQDIILPRLAKLNINV